MEQMALLSFQKELISPTPWFQTSNPPNCENVWNNSSCGTPLQQPWEVIWNLCWCPHCVKSEGTRLPLNTWWPRAGRSEAEASLPHSEFEASLGSLKLCVYTDRQKDGQTNKNHSHLNLNLNFLKNYLFLGRVRKCTVRGQPAGAGSLLLRGLGAELKLSSLVATAWTHWATLLTWKA